MKGLRSTIGLFVVLVGLGAYIYFVASKPTEPTTNQDKLFPGLEAAKIEELTVTSETGEVTSLKKTNDAWEIVAPIATPASAGDTAGITNALVDIDVVRVVEEAPTDLKEYGLDAPRIQIEFKADGGKTSGRLLVGLKNATGGSLYARRADQQRVVLIGQYHEGPLNKSTFDLRDKTIVKFDRDKIDGIELNLAGQTGEFSKAGTDWRMTKPVAARADPFAIEGLLGKLDGAQMKSIVTGSPTPDELRKYGFDKPQVIVNLKMGTERASLTLGREADDATVYARGSLKPDIVTVEPSTAEDLKKPFVDYRKKELFDFRAFNATRIEITHGGQTVVLERVKAKDDSSSDTWHRVSPNAGDPPKEKVESLLGRLADLRATSFVDSKDRTGLDAPVMTVLAEFDEGNKEERVVFGKNGADVFASRSDDQGAAKVDAAKYEEAVKTLDEISK
jgi:hypothetical protein